MSRVGDDEGGGISLSFLKEVCFSSLARRARYDRHAVEAVAGAVRRGRETDLSSFLFFQVFFCCRLTDTYE